MEKNVFSTYLKKAKTANPKFLLATPPCQGMSSLGKKDYVEDERRKQFPFSSIPIHKDLNYGATVTYVNVLLDYGKEYSVYVDNNKEALIMKAYKDYDKAFVVETFKGSKILNMTVEELKAHKIINAGKPRILKFLNPGFSKKEINSEKRKVKTLSKNKNSN